MQVLDTVRYEEYWVSADVIPMLPKRRVVCCYCHHNLQVFQRLTPHDLACAPPHGRTPCLWLMFRHETQLKCDALHMKFNPICILSRSPSTTTPSWSNRTLFPSTNLHLTVTSTQLVSYIRTPTIHFLLVPAKTMVLSSWDVRNRYRDSCYLRNHGL